MSTKNRHRFRDQSSAGIILGAILLIARDLTSDRRISVGHSAEVGAAALVPRRLISPNAQWAIALVALSAGILLSLVVLTSLYNDNSRTVALQGTTPVVSASTPGQQFILPSSAPLTPTVLVNISGGLLQPQEAVAGHNGRIYVADTGKHRIAIFDRRGKLVDSITRGVDGPLLAPFSLVWTPDAKLMVLDSDAGRVLEYNSTGALLRASDPAVSLTHARGIALDPQGNLLVANPALNEIETLGPTLNAIHSQPATKGQNMLFNQPSAVASGSDGSIYVVDSQGGRIVHFTSGWDVLDAWPIPVPDTVHSPRMLPLANNRLLVSDPRDGKLLLYSADGGVPQAFDLGAESQGLVPLGLSLRSDGSVLVTGNAAGQIDAVQIPD